MSQAFMREGDDISLSEVAPSLHALILFLTRNNNGVRVYEKMVSKDSRGRQIHNMSDGLSYGRDEKGKWEVV
jgi:hypothetical protein